MYQPLWWIGEEREMVATEPQRHYLHVGMSAVVQQLNQHKNNWGSHVGLLRGCASSIITGGGGGIITRGGGASTVRGDLLFDLPSFLFFLDTRFVNRECLWHKYNLRNSADQPSHSMQKESKEHTYPRHASHFVCVS